MVHLAEHDGGVRLAALHLSQTVTRYATRNDIPFAWQARFHDHIIRDPDELARITRYIERNMENWGC